MLFHKVGIVSLARHPLRHISDVYGELLDLFIIKVFHFKRGCIKALDIFSKCFIRISLDGHEAGCRSSCSLATTKMGWELST